MEALAAELVKQGGLAVVCAVLLLWLGVVIKNQSEDRKEYVKNTETSNARYEALMGRMLTVMESGTAVTQALTAKIDSITGNQKLREDLIEVKNELITELREGIKDASKATGSRRQP